MNPDIITSATDPTAAESTILFLSRLAAERDEDRARFYRSLQFARGQLDEIATLAQALDNESAVDAVRRGLGESLPELQKTCNGQWNVIAERDATIASLRADLYAANARLAAAVAGSAVVSKEAAARTAERDSARAEVAALTARLASLTAPTDASDEEMARELQTHLRGLDDEWMSWQAMDARTQAEMITAIASVIRPRLDALRAERDAAQAKATEERSERMEIATIRDRVVKDRDLLRAFLCDIANRLHAPEREHMSDLHAVIVESIDDLIAKARATAPGQVAGFDFPAIEWRKDDGYEGHTFRGRRLGAPDGYTLHDGTWSIEYAGKADDEPAARAAVERLHALVTGRATAKAAPVVEAAPTERYAAVERDEVKGRPACMHTSRDAAERCLAGNPLHEWRDDREYRDHPAYTHAVDATAPSSKPAGSDAPKPTEAPSVAVPDDDNREVNERRERIVEAVRSYGDRREWKEVRTAIELFEVAVEKSAYARCLANVERAKARDAAEPIRSNAPSIDPAALADDIVRLVNSYGEAEWTDGLRRGDMNTGAAKKAKDALLAALATVGAVAPREAPPEPVTWMASSPDPRARFGDGHDIGYYATAQEAASDCDANRECGYHVDLVPLYTRPVAPRVLTRSDVTCAVLSFPRIAEDEDGDLFLTDGRVYDGTSEGRRRGVALDDHALWDAYVEACRSMHRARRAVWDAGRPIADADLDKRGK